MPHFRTDFSCDEKLMFLNYVSLNKDQISTHHAQMDLNKKSSAMRQTLIFSYARGFRKTKNENPPTWEIRVTSLPVLANLPTMGRPASTG